MLHCRMVTLCRLSPETITNIHRFLHEHREEQSAAEKNRAAGKRRNTQRSENKATKSVASAFLVAPPDPAGDGGDSTEMISSDDDNTDGEDQFDSSTTTTATAADLPTPWNEGRGVESRAEERGESWLKHCLVAASPGVDTLVVGAVQRFIVLQKSSQYGGGACSPLATGAHPQMGKKERWKMEIVAKVEVVPLKGMEDGAVGASSKGGPSTTDWNHRAYITSLLVLPICSAPSETGKRHATTSPIDWTCVCVGLSNGELRFYTADASSGLLIYTEQCTHHHAPIKQLRFGPSLHPGGQELTALTSHRSHNRLVVMEGASLWNALHSARKLVALRGEQALESICRSLQLESRCLEVERAAVRRTVADFQPLGATRQPVFDQYVRASRESKYARVSPNALPTYNQYLCSSSAGSHPHGHGTTHQGPISSIQGGEEHIYQLGPSQPFASFLWHDARTLPSTVITDALYGLAGQLTQQLPSFGLRSWLGLGVSKRDQPPPSNKVEAADARLQRIHARNSLVDGQRTADRCFVAPPGWPFVALADTQGRVLLISTRSREIVRMWKGCRQARCAWFESTGSIAPNESTQGRSHHPFSGKAVPEESPTKLDTTTTTTLFLAIYSPKRALLEVWSVQSGHRVAAFAVASGGKLVPIASTPYNGALLGAMGSDNTDVGQLFKVSSTSYASTHSVVFLEPSGRVLSLQVPFHLAVGAYVKSHTMMGSGDVTITATSSASAAQHDENLMREFSACSSPTIEASPVGSPTFLHEHWLETAKLLKTAHARQKFLTTHLLNHLHHGSDATRGAISSVESLLNHVGRDGEHRAVVGSAAATGEPTGTAQREETYLQRFILILKLHSALEELWGRMAKALQSMPLALPAYESLAALLRFSEDARSELSSEVYELLQQKFGSGPETLAWNISDFLPSVKRFHRWMEVLLNSEGNSGKWQEGMDAEEMHMLSEAIFLPLLFHYHLLGGSAKIENEEAAAAMCSIVDDAISALDSIPPHSRLNLYLEAWLGGGPLARWPFSLLSNATALLRRILFRNCCAHVGEVKAKLKLLRERVIQRVFKSPQLQASLLLCLQLRALQTEFLEAPSSFCAAPAETDGGLKVKRMKIEVEEDSAIVGQKKMERMEETPHDEKFLLVDDEAVDEINSAKEGAEWEWSMGDEWEWLDLVSKHLIALSLLQQLSQGCRQPTSVTTVEPLSLEKLTLKGRGFYREQIGVWAVRNGVTPLELAQLLSSVSGKEEENSSSEESNEHLPSIEAVKKLLLHVLQRQMPLSMRAELILCDCCWEAASEWFRDDAKRTGKLELSMDYLALLDSAPPRIQHGMALIVWDTLVRDSFQRLMRILYGDEADGGLGGNVAMVTKMDRVLKRDVLVVEKDLPQYVQCIRRLLEHLSSSIGRMSERDSKSSTGGYTHLYEDFVERFFQHARELAPNTAGDTSSAADSCGWEAEVDSAQVGSSRTAKRRETQLTQMLCRYTPVNYHLVVHHTQLALIVQLQLATGVSSRSPDTLFDSNGRRAFFTPLHSHPLLPLAGVDTECKARRQQFLESVVEAAGSSEREECRAIWRVALRLAGEWELDVEGLQMREILSLYTTGLDTEAEALLPRVEKKQMLATALLSLIGSRVHILLEAGGAPLRLRCYQCSAASAVTLTYADRQETHGIAATGVQATQRLIDMTTSLLKSKQRVQEKQQPQSLSSQRASKTEMARQLHLLREMDAICRLAVEGNIIS